MRILVVSWYFPPVNTIGAVRVGKFARFLLERGHDIGVVAGKYWGHPETMPLGVELKRIVHANSFNINAVLQRLRHALRRRAAAPVESTSHAANPGAEGGRTSILHRLAAFYQNLTNLPDNRVGWMPWAYAGCIHLCRDWRPDLIFASGPPFTAHVAAALASNRLRIPWVAELRDRWADDPYDPPPPWRLAVDQGLERRVLGSARALVTVSEPWAEFYRRKYDKPVATIYNGYEPAEFDFAASEGSPGTATPLIIGYTGGIYPGKRDPTPVFEALRLLGKEGESIRVIFRGSDPAAVLPLAERVGVAHVVEALPPIPYRQSLEFQRQADVLLLMQWNDPREQGSCPGKLFEYIASLRPVLVLGLDDGVPATIVRLRQAGFCSNDAAEIAGQLRVWLRQKQELGHVPSLPVSAREGLSRIIQFERLEEFLLKVSSA